MRLLALFNFPLMIAVVSALAYVLFTSVRVQREAPLLAPRLAELFRLLFFAAVLAWLLGVGGH